MKSIYARSGRALYECGGRLLLVEMLLLVLLLVPAYSLPLSAAALLTVSLGTSELLQILILSGTVLFLLLISLFLTTPLVMGLFFAAGRLASGKTAVLGDLFHAFSSWRRYGRALRAGKRFFLLTSLLVLLLFGGAFVIDSFLSEGMIALLLPVSAFPLGIVAAYFFVPLFGNSAMRFSDTDGWRKCTYGEGLRFRAHFFLWILLGVLTFGILLLADVLPRMLIAYFEERTPNDIKEDGTAPSLSDK